jgi:hypothetical protein
LFQLERCGDKIEIDKSQDHEHQVVLFSNSFFANLGWVKFAIGPWALGLGFDSVDISGSKSMDSGKFGSS